MSPVAHKQPSLIALDKPDLPNLLIKRTRLSALAYSLTSFEVPSHELNRQLNCYLCKNKQITSNNNSLNFG